jgi:hypothetical protein
MEHIEDLLCAKTSPVLGLRTARAHAAKGIRWLTVLPFAEQPTRRVLQRADQAMAWCAINLGVRKRFGFGGEIL